MFDADEAYSKRLVNKVVPDGEVEREAYATAKRIAAGAPLVARWHKRFIERLTVRASLSAEEWDEGFACFDTEDYREGRRGISREAQAGIQRPVDSWPINAGAQLNPPAVFFLWYAFGGSPSSAHRGPGGWRDRSRSMNKLIAYLSKLPPGRLLMLCLVLVAVIGVADYQTGYEMNMAVVYLAPIFLVAWTLGTHAAIVMSIICTTAWYLSMLNMHQNYSQPLLHVWDGAIQFAMFVIFGIVISKLKSALSHADERFATVLEGLDAAVYVADGETGEVLYANDQFRKTFPAGSQLPSMPHAVQQGEFHDAGRGRWYLVHSSPMRWADGRVVRLQLATDITERRRTEALAMP